MINYLKIVRLKGWKNSNMNKLTNLQRLGISLLLLKVYEHDKSIDKGGLIDFKTDTNAKFINIYFRCYNNKRYTFTLQVDENIDDTLEYRVKYDSDNNIFRIIDMDDVMGWNA